MPYDTFNIKVPGKQNGTYTNLHYYYQIDKAGGASVLNFVSGTLNFKAGGTGATISCAMPAPDTSASTSALTKFNWDFTNMLGGACGFPSSLNTGDSIWVDMKFVVTTANNSLLYGAKITTPANGQSYFYNVDAASTKVFCDVWSPDIYLLGLTLTGDGAYNTSPVNLSGCTPGTQSFINYGFTTSESGDIFPGEFRPGVKLDSVLITLPNGISWTGSNINLSSDTFGLPYQRFTTVQSLPGTLRGSQVVLINPGNWRTSDMVPATYVSHLNMNLSLVANCAALATGNIITVKTYGKSFVYAGVNTPFVSTYTSTGTDGLGITYNPATKPNTTVQNNTGTIQGLLPQQYWDVQINSLGTVTAPYIWMALEKSTGSGGIAVDSVVLKPGNIVLAPNTYNGTDKWYQVSTVGLASGAVQQARVYFKYSSCTADSILLRSGWNCTGYPSPDPLTGVVCSASQTYLKVIPQPSQVQLSVLQQPGNGASTSLCSMDSVLVVINSAQAGNLVSPYVNVYPPAGVNIQTPIQVEYPLGSGNYQNAALTGIGGGAYKIDLTAHTAIGVNGLPGTVINPGTMGRQAKIKVTYTTACGITSGIPLTFGVYGNQPCSSPATGNGSLTQTAGVTITGATNAGAAGLSMNTPVTTLSCGQGTTLGLTVTAVDNPTQTGDTVVYTLPAGLNYNGNFTGGYNCSACTVTTLPGNAGTTLVKVTLQAGIAEGDSLKYTFDIIPGGQGCGPVKILSSARRDIPGLTCGSFTCAGTSVVIGADTSAAITINKPVLSTSVFTFNENIFSGPRTVNYSFNINNSGNMASAAGAYLVKIYCGTNNNGNVLASFYANAVNAGATITQSGSFNYPSAVDCSASNLFLKLQDSLDNGTKACMCAPSSGAVSSVILPVKLIGFNGRYDKGTAKLNWTATNETSIKNYTIERSIDGLNFTAISAVASTNASQNSYTYTDAAIPVAAAKLYYRLRINEINGTFEYSNTLVIKSGAVSGNMEIAPNPASSYIGVSFAAIKTAMALIEIIDANGQVVSLYHQPIQSGNNNIQLTGLDKLPMGTYTLKLNDGESNQYAKFMIVK